METKSQKNKYTSIICNFFCPSCRSSLRGKTVNSVYVQENEREQCDHLRLLYSQQITLWFPLGILRQDYVLLTRPIRQLIL